MGISLALGFVLWIYLADRLADFLRAHMDLGTSTFYLGWLLIICLWIIGTGLVASLLSKLLR